MSPKAVRFSDENEAIPPRTPSPTFSATTTSSHSSPQTPPSVAYFSPVPNVKQGSPVGTLHGEYSLHESLSEHDKTITFNLNYSPSDIRNDLYISVAKSTLSARATDAPSMQITPLMETGRPPFPWTIVISPKTGEIITVCTVLTGIFEALHTPLTPDEYLRTPELEQANAEKRRRYRITRQPEHDGRWRMIDWLPTAARQFGGLIRSNGDLNSWTLRLEDLKEPYPL